MSVSARRGGSAKPVVAMVEIASLAAPGEEPETLRARCGEWSHKVDWPRASVNAARALADPNRYARGGGRFAGPESGPALPPDGSESPIPGVEGRSRELAELVMGAETAGKELGQFVARVLPDEVRDALDAGEPVRVELQFPLGDPAAQMPWEFLRLDEGRPICLRDGGSVVRRLGSEPPHVQTPARPAKLTLQALNLSQRWQRDFSEPLDVLLEHGAQQISEPMGLGACDVLVVMGHGAEPRDGVPRIARVEPSTLIERLVEVGWPAAVVLLACRSAEGAEGARSFADNLTHAGAPAVVGMLGDIETERQAPAFLRGLLEALEAGAGLEAAVQQARVQMATTGSALWQWGLPVLTGAGEDFLPAAIGTDFRVDGLPELVNGLRSFGVVVLDHTYVDEDVIGISTDAGGTGADGIVIGSNLIVRGSVIGNDQRRPSD